MDKKLPIGTKYCKCSGCGLYFTTEPNFDLHRREIENVRSCVPPEALMTRTGKRKLVLNAKGYWCAPSGVKMPKPWAA